MKEEDKEKMLSVEKVKAGEVASVFIKPDENIEDDIEKYPESPEVISKLKAAQEKADKYVRPTTESGGNTTNTSHNNGTSGTFQKDIKNQAKDETKKVKEVKELEQNTLNPDIEKTR